VLDGAAAEPEPDADEGEAGQCAGDGEDGHRVNFFTGDMTVRAFM
jgi:hypothetical protein